MGDYKEIFLIINLLPFIYSNWTYTSRLIIINGTLFHGTKFIYPKYSDKFRTWDVICNLLISIYVNYTSTWQPYTKMFILFAGICWRLNTYFNNNNKFIHAFFVQTPLYICSYYV